jgi:hypothetical protein
MQAPVSVQETTDGAVLVRVHRELDAEAAVQLGADHDVAVTVQYREPRVGWKLRAAGMPHEQLHHR